MISVEIGYRQDTRVATLKVKGHAGQAEIGQDIVCASASILAYTLAQVIKSMEHHGDLIEPPTIALESGDTEISCRARDDYLFAEVLHAFFVIKTGYALLAHNYPQFVELITDGKDI